MASPVIIIVKGYCYETGTLHGHVRVTGTSSALWSISLTRVTYGFVTIYSFFAFTQTANMKLSISASRGSEVRASQ